MRAYLPLRLCQLWLIVIFTVYLAGCGTTRYAHLGLNSNTDQAYASIDETGESLGQTPSYRVIRSRFPFLAPDKSKTITVRFRQIGFEDDVVRVLIDEWAYSEAEARLGNLFSVQGIMYPIQNGELCTYDTKK